MKMYWYYILLILSNAFYSCDKDIPMPLEPEPEEPIELCDIVDEDNPLIVDWCNVLHPDTSYVDMTAVPIKYGDKLFSLGSIGDPGENQALYVYSVDDGTLIQRIPISSNRGSCYKIYSKEKYLVIPYAFNGIEVYDMNNLSLVWSYESIGKESNSQYVSFFGNDIIVPISYGTLPYEDSVIIARFELETGFRQNVFTITRADLNGGSPSVPSVVVNQLSNGDEVYYFAMSVLQPGVDQREHCWAYNASRNEYQWKRNDIDPIVVHNDPLIIYEDAVNILATELHTLDKYTGEEINKVDVSGDYGFQAPLLYKGKMYANSAQGHLICTDAATGDLIWSREGAGTFTQKTLNIHKDRLYYSGFDEKLHVYDTNTGERLYKVKSPFSKGVFHIGGQAIDTETDHMYTTDGFRVMRLELLR